MSEQLLWQNLENHLTQQIATFPGIVGIALTDLSTSHTLQINASEVFPTASTIKIHILTQLLLRAADGEVDLTERIAIPKDKLVGGSGVLAYLDDSPSLTLLDMANLMIIASDNTATNLCLERAGIEETNTLLRQLGLTQTQVRRQMMDHLAAVRELENVSTPAELVQMLALLQQGQPTPEVAERCLTILKKPKHGFIDRALPVGLLCANKPGWVEGAMCDAGIIYLARRPYILAIMTKYAQCNSVVQENFIVACVQTIHQTMTALNVSNRYGRSVYSS